MFTTSFNIKKIFALCFRSVSTCFVQFAKQTAAILFNSLNEFSEMKKGCVFCKVGTKVCNDFIFGL